MNGVEVEALICRGRIARRFQQEGPRLMWGLCARVKLGALYNEMTLRYQCLMVLGKSESSFILTFLYSIYPFSWDLEGTQIYIPVYKSCKLCEVSGKSDLTCVY